MDEKQIMTEFDRWMYKQGYISPEGELFVELRDAQALYLQTCIHEDKVEIEKCFVRIAKNLWTFYSQGYWVELGFSNFEEFLRSPDVDIAVSVGYGLKEIGHLLEEGIFTEAQAMEIGPSKLRALLPAIKENPDNIEELLDKASELNYLDLIDEVSGKDVFYYRGKGKLPDLIDELRGRPEFWEGDITLNAKTY